MPSPSQSKSWSDNLPVYQITGEFLTPVHIGANKELEPFDYFIDVNERRFYRFSFLDFFHRLPKEKQDELQQAIESGELHEIRKLLAKEQEKAKKTASYSCGVSDLTASKYEEKFGEPENQLLISPFIRTEAERQPFIPGSAIKGAIRTAVLSYIGSTKIENEKQESTPLQQRFLLNELNQIHENEDYGDYRARKLQAELLNYWGYADRRKHVGPGKDRPKILLHKDPFRAVDVVDTHLPDKATLIAEIRRMEKDEQKQLKGKGPSTFYEVTYSRHLNDTTTGWLFGFTTELRIDANLWIRYATGKELHIAFIRDACNDFYRKRLKQEHDFYCGTSAENVSQTLHDEPIDENSFLLRIGRFSGYESVTLDEFRDPKKLPQTRILAELKYPMGWVKITYQPKPIKAAP
jgi:CRISPR-associated protein Csm5